MADGIAAIHQAAASGSPFYSVLDIIDGFHCIKIDERSQKAHGFRINGQTFVYTRLLQGNRASPNTFSKCIRIALEGLENVSYFVDDVIIYEPDEAAHQQTVLEVIRRLQQYGLNPKPSKMKLMEDSVRFLGFDVTKNSIAVNADTIQPILHLPFPKTAKSLRSFIGMIGHMRHFIPHAAKYEAILKEGVEKTVPRTPEKLQAFEYLRSSLAKLPSLHIPTQMNNLVLYTDASTLAAGAVLEDGDGHVISFGSHMWSSAEKKMTLYQLEARSLTYFVEKWRDWLRHIQFTIWTDSDSLRQALESPKSLPNWSVLADLDFVVEHVA